MLAEWFHPRDRVFPGLFRFHDLHVDYLPMHDCGLPLAFDKAAPLVEPDRP